MSLITITELSLKVYASESAVNTWREIQESGQKNTYIERNYEIIR